MQARIGCVVSIALMSAACGGPRRADSVPIGAHASHPGPTGERDVEEEKVDCPDSIRKAENTECPKQYAQCTYPEGDCGCGPRVLTCGDSTKSSVNVWQCRPKESSLLRADGCPFESSSPWMGCTEPGRVCVYPSCPSERISKVCDKKLLHWVPTRELLSD